MPQAIRVAQPRRPILKTGHPLARKMVLAQVFSAGRIWDAVRGLPAASINGGPKLGTGITRGASAMGFGSTYGSGTTDRIDTSLATDSAQRSWYGRFFITSYSASRVLDTGSNGGGFGGGGVAEIVVVRTYTGATAVYEMPDNTVPLNQWVDILFTWDSSGSDTPIGYYNGIPIALNAITALSGSFVPSTSAICLGNRSDNARSLPGMVECAYVWDRILSPAEAMALYINPYQMFAPASEALQASAASSVVQFSGTVSNQSHTQNVAGFSLDLSGFFSGSLTPFTYSLQAGTLPTGLSLNSSTGAITGTPTVVETKTGIVVRATDTGANTADTNSFQIQINAPAGGTGVVSKVIQQGA